MEKEFVPYELALRMKQLGFDESCFRYYWERFENSPRMMNQYGSPKSNSNLDKLAKTELKGLQGTSYCAAPLFQQAFRWLREKYDWTIKVNQVTKNNWSYTLENFPEERTYYGETYNTYEEAELACLDKLLSIVELKQQEQ